MNSAVLFLFLFAGSALGASMKGGKCPTPSGPPAGFDISKYLGLWYEIRRSETPNEKGVRCNTAHYSLLADGNINVTNSGTEISTGNRRSVFLTATQVTKDLPNYFNVVFAPQLPPASYWIVDTDFDTYSTVISCVQITKDVSMPLGWILSRTPQLDASIEQRLVDLLASKGVDQLLTSDQSDCTY